MYGGGASKKTVERRIDSQSLVDSWAQLNLDKSIYYARFKQPRNNLKTCLVKVIPLTGANPQQQELVLRSTFGASSYYFKPEAYDIQPDGNLYLFQKVQPLSLQSVIWIHRLEGKSFSKEFMRQFTVRIYEGLARLKSKDPFPRNLKPSNIFLELREGEERSWVWSEAGLHTSRPSQAYFKLSFDSKNNSVKAQPIQLQFYSLAIILIQMATLQPSKDIDDIIRKRRQLSELRNYSDAMEWYNEPLTSIIKMLLDPVLRDPKLGKAIQQYKEMIEDDDQSIDYGQYAQTEQRIQRYVKDGLLKRVLDEAKDHIQQRNVSARDVFDVMGRLDSGFDFYFNNLSDMNELLRELGVKVGPDQLLFITNFYTSSQLIRYFKLIQQLFPARDLIECIITQAVGSYDSFKDFFEAQTQGRGEYWKADAIKDFLQMIDAPFQKADVDRTVEEWSGPHKTSVKYDQLYKIFKPILGMSMSFTNLKSKSMLQGGGSSIQQQPLRSLMEQLKQKQPDLIEFFRKYDLKQNWILDYKIQKTLSNYMKGDAETKKRAFAEMWQKGGIPGDLTKQINYVYLLRNIQLYEPITLLRLILTTKINQTDRETFYTQYKRGQGWTIDSFIDFNRDENLDFDEKELRALFKEIDTDGSQSVSGRELFYRLTGLKQFDYKSIVEDVKHALSQQGINFFDMFLQSDKRARMVLSNPSDLDNVLKKIGVSVSEDHLAQLYAKFAPTGKFEYLKFLREFEELKPLFLAATRAVLKQNYRNDFEKLFEMGLKDGRTKWKRSSLVSINEEMVLGFKELELGKIWDQLDSKNDGSLTKDEVAEIYRYQVQKLTQLQRRHVESLHDLANKNTNTEAINPKSGIDKAHKDEGRQKSVKVIDELREEIGLRKMAHLSVSFLRQSERFNGHIREERAIGVLSNSGVRCNKKEISEFLQRFVEKQTSQDHILNHIKLIMYAIEMMADQGSTDRPAAKAEVIKALMRAVKGKKNISNRDIMNMCRKSERMRLSDFEAVIGHMLEVEVFFEDLEQVWMYWDVENYLSETDLDTLLETNQFSNRKPEKEREDEKVRGDRKPPLLLPKKAYSKIVTQLGSENRMTDFINQSEANSPSMRKDMSFGQRENSRKSSRKGSFKDHEPNSKIPSASPSHFRQNSHRERAEAEPTGRFHESSRRNAPKEEKIQLQQREELSSPFRRFASKRQGLSKEELVEKMMNQIGENGQSYLNELFAKVKNRTVQSNRFEGCLKVHYNFNEADAKALTKTLQDFGYVKEDKLKNQMKKNRSPAQKGQEKDRTFQKSDRKRGKHNERLKTPPAQDRGVKRLVNHGRSKINVPAVREQIHHLRHLFIKRFDITDLQNYFFHDNKYAKDSKCPKEMIDRETFRKTCQSIDENVTSSMCDKMFTYLSPDSQDRVGILAFKMGMDLDELIRGEEDEDYLPDDLQKELRAVFDKADADHSGYIQSNEIERLLSSLGFNENVRQLQNYFARLDGNFDNKIEYQQFRLFIEDQILPQISNFDQDQEELQEALINNDIFRTGGLSPNVFQAVIDRYGVKLFPQQVQRLIRALSPERTDIGIKQFMQAVKEPTRFHGKARAILYKIRLRKKVQLRQIQKVFESIASPSFAIAYTPSVMHQKLLNISSPYAPSLHESGLFYSDLPIKDMRKVGLEGEASVVGEIVPSDILVEVVLKQLTGVPIPQRNEIKNNILRRYINICLFDLSSDSARHSMWQIDVEWQTEVEDEWLIPKAYRSLFVKIAGYDHRKYEKMVLLFELIIGVVEIGKTLQINCGCCTIPLRDLLVPEGKINKSVKLIAGLPNRTKELDSSAITKRGGWKSFFGGSVESQLQVDLIHREKFKDYHSMLAAMPAHAILPRKSVPYLHAYRQYLADIAYAGGSLNSFAHLDHKVMTFLHTLDVPELTNRIWLWWKLKAETNIKNIGHTKKVFRVLMQELSLIVNARQFELLRKSPSRPLLYNKTLSTTRGRLIGQALDNVDSWIDSGIENSFKRKKNYTLNYGPMQMHEVEIPRQHRNFIETLNKLTVR